ncbi:MAG: ArnT family glycosyltransferase, partial [Nitrososphaerales archaeon]
METSRPFPIRAQGRVLAGPALLIAALALYGLANLYQLQLPGLYYDEALDAVPAMQLLAGQPLDITRSFHLFGREWPLMVMTYVGSTTSYLVAPAFALFGVSVTVLRLVNISLGVLTLVLAWGFLREFFDDRVAGIATLLLAANPTFIFWSRLGAFVSLPMLPLGIAALWALYRWRQRRRDGYLILAAFCLGVGLTTKLLFLWFWVALGLAWLLLSPLLESGSGRRAWLWPFRRISRRTFVLACLALLAGCAPLIAYNLADLGTVTTVLDNFRRTSLYGVNNLSLLANLKTVVGTDLRMFLEGTWFGDSFGAVHANRLAVPALAIALVVILYLLARNRLEYSRTRVYLLLILFVSILVQSAFTITGLGPTHLMILWPMPQALIAMALLSIPTLIPASKRALPALVVVLTLVLVASEAWTTWQYHRTLAATGGVGSFSDSIPALASDLARDGVTRPIALDWGFRRSIQLLTGGRVNAEERFDYASHPTDVYRNYINDAVSRDSRSETSKVYLFHAPEHTVFEGHWEPFEEAAYRYGLTPVLSKTYRQRNGEPVSLVYRLEPAAPLQSLPTVAKP